MDDLISRKSLMDAVDRSDDEIRSFCARNVLGGPRRQDQAAFYMMAARNGVLADIADEPAVQIPTEETTRYWIKVVEEYKEAAIQARNRHPAGSPEWKRRNHMAVAYGVISLRMRMKNGDAVLLKKALADEFQNFVEEVEGPFPG